MGWIPGGSRLLKVMARAMLTLIAVHMFIGLWLTAETWRLQKKAGTAYRKENRLFWARRISGFALFVLIFFHMAVFLHGRQDVVRLTYFGIPQLVSHILMALSLLVHILCNIRPLLISFGIRGRRLFVRDILFVLAGVLLFCAAAFAVYYLRWNIWWRAGG